MPRTLILILLTAWVLEPAMQLQTESHVHAGAEAYGIAVTGAFIFTTLLLLGTFDAYGDENSPGHGVNLINPGGEPSLW